MDSKLEDSAAEEPKKHESYNYDAWYLESKTPKFEVDELNQPSCGYEGFYLHREDGPAFLGEVIEYYYENKLHRLDGPAVIHECSVTWYVYGQLICSEYEYMPERRQEVMDFFLSNDMTKKENQAYAILKWG